MIAQSLVVLLVCQFCAVSSYQITSRRMQVTMMAGPFDFLNKASGGGGGGGGGAGGD